MSMSRKQYRDIAAVISDAVAEEISPEASVLYAQGWIISYIAAGLAAVFEIDNPRFDRERFMEACGIEK
jgi:hypothetical protein